jgi:hypothetical protein
MCVASRASLPKSAAKVGIFPDRTKTFCVFFTDGGKKGKSLKKNRRQLYEKQPLVRLIVKTPKTITL